MRLTQPIPNSASFIIHYLHSSRSFYFISFPLFSFYIEYHEQKTAVYFILDFMINAMDPPLYFGIKFGKCLYTTFYLSRLREKGNKIYITGGYVWPKFSFTCGLEWYLQNSSLRYIISLYRLYI